MSELLPEPSSERVYPENYHFKRPVLYYHLARYHFAKSLLRREDRVVDAACGAGYGSFDLASVAEEVIGIDHSDVAIDYCRKHFASGNITFQVGNIETLDELLQPPVDAVVSFETIEHLTRQGQQKFIAAVNRILSDKGVFIISTPNTLIYSGGKPTLAEFHLCELTPTEFRAALEPYFGVVQIFGQRKFEGSTAKGLLFMLGGNLLSLLRRKFRSLRVDADAAQQISDFEFTSFDIESCEYLVAICKRPKRG